MISESIKLEMFWTKDGGLQNWKSFMETGAIPCVDYCWERPSNIFCFPSKSSKDLEIISLFLCANDFKILTSSVLSKYCTSSKFSGGKHEKKVEEEDPWMKRAIGMDHTTCCLTVPENLMFISGGSQFISHIHSGISVWRLCTILL
jgi:hypothetical protein